MKTKDLSRGSTGPHTHCSETILSEMELLQCLHLALSLSRSLHVRPKVSGQTPGHPAFTALCQQSYAQLGRAWPTHGENAHSSANQRCLHPDLDSPWLQGPHLSPPACTCALVLGPGGPTRNLSASLQRRQSCVGLKVHLWDQ